MMSEQQAAEAGPRDLRSNLEGAPMNGVSPQSLSPPTPAPSPGPAIRQESASFETTPIASSSAAATSSSTFPPPQQPADSPPSSPELHASFTEDVSRQRRRRNGKARATDSEDEDALAADFERLSFAARARLLERFVNSSRASILSPLLPRIEARLKRDFLRELPIELAFHVLAFVDDAQTLARASAVSRAWRALLEDEATWRTMCWRSGFVPSQQHASPSTSTVDVASPTSPQSSAISSRLRTIEFGDRQDEPRTPAGRERRATAAAAAAAGAVQGRNADQLASQMATTLSLAGGGPTPSAPTPTSSRGAAPPSDPAAPARVGNGAEIDLDAWISMRATTPTPQAADDSARVPPRDYSLFASRGLGFANSAAALARRVASPLLASSSPSPDQQHPSPARIPLELGPDSAPWTPAREDYDDDQTRAATLGRRSRPHSDLSAPPTPRGFSYKSHFKRAYLTESAWLRGPGTELATQLSAVDGVVTCMGFDDQWLVVGMATSKIHIFDSHTGEYAKTLDGHQLGVWCLALVTKTQEDSRPRVVRRRSSFNGTETARSPSSNNRSPSSGGMGLGAGGETGSGQSSACNTARGHGNAGALVVSGGCDHAVRVWAVESGDLLHVLRGHTSTVRCVRVANSRPLAVSGARNGVIRVWNIATGEAVHTLNGHGFSVRCLEVSGSTAISGSYDRTCRVWNIDTGECMHVLSGHLHQIYTVAFDPQRRHVVSGSLDSTVRLWSADTG